MRTNRLIFLLICLFACSILILTSLAGTLAPIEGAAATPLNFLSGIFNRITFGANQLAGDLAEIQSLQERNAELEEAIALYQAELVELREIASDYNRLAELVDYTSSVQSQETLSAEVIGYDPNSQLRTIVINRGARDGLANGMPVVTQQGLVGRIIDVFATTSRILLITDPTSAISARLQTTRSQGSVIGLLEGNLRMIMVPLDEEVQVGDIVITSGLGGNFPSDIPIGQVESKRQFEFELNQTAEVRSLIDFDKLEFVLVVTSFLPVDLSAFETEDDG